MLYLLIAIIDGVHVVQKYVDYPRQELPRLRLGIFPVRQDGCETSGYFKILSLWHKYLYYLYSSHTTGWSQSKQNLYQSNQTDIHTETHIIVVTPTYRTKDGGHYINMCPEYEMN